MLGAPEPPPEKKSSSNLQGVSRLTYGLLAAAVIGGLIFMYTFEIASAAIINGAIKVHKNRQVLQHTEGGRIAAVLVTEGQLVKSGDVLMELDNPLLRSTHRSLTRQLFSEQMRAQRLQAETHYPEIYRARPEGGPDVDRSTILSTEQRLFDSRRRNLQSQLISVEQQINFVKDEIAALTRTVSNDETLTGRNKELGKQGFLSEMAVLNNEQTLQLHKAELARAKQRVAELQQRLSVLVEDFQNSAATEYRTTNERILEIEEKLKPTSESLNNLKVRATIDGAIVNLTRLGPGSVLGPKETIAEIVPVNRELILEGHLPTEQVAFVKPGMSARINIQQLKKILGKELVGTVLTVSADSMAQGALGTWTYLVRIEITDVDLALANMLRPGMPAEIHIQTGTQTIFDYLAAPIKTYMGRAMREPN